MQTIEKIPSHIDPIALSDAEWQQKLPPETYRVMRHHATEAPTCSPLNAEKRAGTYVCAACALPLFGSDDKYESKSGWPSFTRPLAPQVVATTTDMLIGYERTEVHCPRCEGHLGHVFPDGPPPTSQRYCMNGAALTFLPLKGN